MAHMDKDDKVLTEHLSQSPSAELEDEEEAVEVGFRTWYKTDAP